MRIGALVFIFAFVFVALDGAEAASRITTKDGTVIVGDIESLQSNFYTIRTPYVRNARALSISTECGLTFDPKEFAVKTEEYPLARRLFLYTPQRATNRSTEPFVDYALSSAAQPITEKEGFVSLQPQPSAQDYVGQRIGQAAENQDDTAEAARQFSRFSRAVAPSSRLSITYRFQSGSDALDSRAVRDIERLAEFLSLPENRGRKVTLAGFSDSRGSFGRNVGLSLNRARAIANELGKRNVNLAQIEGYGPVAPVACNSTDEGLQKNRRVEVWMR